MAWPPPVLPTNRTNATPQQNTHPNDHNATNLAVNDLVTRVSTNVATFQQMLGGATGPILANSTYTPFTLTHVAVGYERIVTVNFQYFLAVGAGGTAVVELHHGSGTILSSVQAPGGVTISAAGSYVTRLAAGAAFPMYLLVRANVSGTNVYADSTTNQISVVGTPA